MDTQGHVTRDGLDPEALLLSPRKSWALLALCVVLVSALSSLQLHELLGGFRRRGPDFHEVFLRQLVTWGAWAVVMIPLVRLAAWMLADLRSWVLFLVIQLPISVAVGSGSVALGFALRHLGGGGPGGPGRGDITFERLWAFRLTREMLVYWALLAIGGGVVAFLRSRREERRSAELTLRAARLEAELAQAQVDTLRSQLHPHFLFNALHAVGGLVRAGEPQTAVRMLSAIGELLRASLDQGERQRVRLEDELRLVDRYLDIQQVRLGDRLKTRKDVPAGLQDAAVPAMLLLPLVENAVQHGVEQRTEGGTVTVVARAEEGVLALEVHDDGPGFPPERLGVEDLAHDDGRRHIGIANCRERLRMLYGEAGVLELANGERGGAVVRVRLPLEELGRG